MRPLKRRRRRRILRSYLRRITQFLDVKEQQEATLWSIAQSLRCSEVVS